MKKLINYNGYAIQETSDGSFKVQLRFGFPRATFPTLKSAKSAIDLTIRSIKTNPNFLI